MEKYYTPAIEDIHVGYECEIKSFEEDEKWIKVIFSTPDLTPPLNKMVTDQGEIYFVPNSLRTPYLTKEQIEAEGWVEHNGQDFIVAVGYEFNRIPFSKGDYRLDYNYELQILAISKFSDFLFCYYGKCPSINELRVICKLLDI